MSESEGCGDYGPLHRVRPGSLAARQPAQLLDTSGPLGDSDFVPVVAVRVSGSACGVFVARGNSRCLREVAAVCAPPPTLSESIQTQAAG